MINFQNLTDDVNKYLVTPMNQFGLGGFVFDVEGETSVNLTAEITDHYLEDNTTIQDHIAIKPDKVVLKSYVGELVYYDDEEGDSFVETATRKLTTLVSYAPILSQGAQQLFAQKTSGDVLSLENFKENVTSLTINRAVDYWAFVKNLVGQQSRQQQAYVYFKSLMKGKYLLAVQTPFEYMTNMAIESIVARQDENEKYVSDFSITLKKIRTAEILNVPSGDVEYVENQTPQSDLYQGRASAQYSDEVYSGYVNGSTIEERQANARNENLRRMLGDAVSLDDLEGIIDMSQEDVERALEN